MMSNIYNTSAPARSKSDIVYGGNYVIGGDWAMIRRMKHGEEDNVRALIAKLSYEDQTYWRKKTKTLEQYFAESSRVPVGEEIKGKNVILIAEDGLIVGLCWCTIVTEE